jgi:hypothetical protein
VTYNTLDLFFVATSRSPDTARPLDAVADVFWLDPNGINPDEIAFESMRRALQTFLRRERTWRYQL